METASCGGSLMPEVRCPSCRKKIRPPDHLAGKRVTCPRCEAVLTVPLLVGSSQEIALPPPPPQTNPEDSPLPSSARFGIVALLLGCVSGLILCLPFACYASIALSGIGLPIGLWGLIRASMEDGIICRSLTGGAGIAGNFGMRAQDYPLAGIATCFLALALALVPILMR
jgi:hypothetical protein